MNKKDLTSRQRKYVILLRLLDQEHLSYQHLAEDYLVARSSIANDIIFIKNLLSEDNVPLKFDNSGTFVDASEIKRQEVIKRVISKLDDEKDNDIKSLYLDSSLFQKVKKVISAEEKRYLFKIPEIYLKNIILTTTILIQRSRDGFRIEISTEKEDKPLWQLQKLQLANELIQSVQCAGIYTFTNNELKYLSYIVLGSGIDFFIDYDSIPQEFKLQVLNFIKDVGNGLNRNYLINDKRLEQDLTLHIYQMILRLKTNTTVINPLLEIIKNKYSKTFGVVWYFLNSDFELQISDDEVAFITIHFQAAIERQKEAKKILFVCPHGIGTSSLASAQLRRILPTNSMIETVSLIKVSERDLSDVDLIVSTIPLPKLNVPVVKISPILTTEDMKRVMDEYIDTTMSKNLSPQLNTDGEEKLIKLLKGHVLLVDQSNSRKIMEQLSSFNDWDDEDQCSNYLTTVDKREKIQSTYLGNGFAIPHGNPKLIKQSTIAVAILKRPIKWGNNKVDIISLLMIANQDKNMVEPFMELIMKGINDKEWFIRKIMEFN